MKKRQRSVSIRDIGSSLALQDAEEMLPGHLIGIFQFSVDYCTYLSCAKRLSEAGERTTRAASKHAQ
jgi:hypothetical protein